MQSLCRRYGLSIKLGLCAAVSVAAMGAVALGATGDWPQFRGPNRDQKCTETGLLKQFEDTNDEELISKRENVLEFLGAVQEFENLSDDQTLEAFIENVALVSDLDMQGDAPQFVTLMTLHSAKGLEYENVYLIDVNEGVMPYKKAVLDQDIEEERRMFYVGMTRAKKYLHLFSVKQMNQKDADISRFIAEAGERLSPPCR